MELTLDLRTIIVTGALACFIIGVTLLTTLLTGRFTRSGTVNFRVKQATSPSGGGGGNFPNVRRCGGAPLNIDATTTIAGLRIRAGAYRLYVLRGSCNGEEQALGRILQLGRLPSQWTLTVQTAQFNRNGKGRFYIQRIIG